MKFRKVQLSNLVLDEISESSNLKKKTYDFGVTSRNDVHLLALIGIPKLKPAVVLPVNLPTCKISIFVAAIPETFLLLVRLPHISRICLPVVTACELDALVLILVCEDCQT